ncbi:hypothetical protein A3Q56_01950 [Intoshia linei]|uniref:Uncharacterized protein n=1 Tax=Intoshia linei TaxID=1819745 RepID=A0A177BA17_9BILA|nr:hypothetical protein A3Q56_01950 [Intoshia linei]
MIIYYSERIGGLAVRFKLTKLNSPKESTTVDNYTQIYWIETDEKIFETKKNCLLKLAMGDRSRLRLKRCGSAQSYAAIKKELHS